MSDTSYIQSHVDLVKSSYFYKSNQMTGSYCIMEPGNLKKQHRGWSDFIMKGRKRRRRRRVTHASECDLLWPLPPSLALPSVLGTQYMCCHLVLLWLAQCKPGLTNWLALGKPKQR